MVTITQEMIKAAIIKAMKLCDGCEFDGTINEVLDALEKGEKHMCGSECPIIALAILLGWKPTGRHTIRVDGPKTFTFIGSEVVDLSDER